MAEGGDTLGRTLRFVRDHVLAAVEEVTPLPGIPGARVCATPSLPDVWELNVVLAESVADPAAAKRLIAAAGRAQRDAGLRHRALRFSEPVAAAALAEPARAAGWTLERDIVMVRRRAPDRPFERSERMIDADAAALTVAEDTFLRSEPVGRSPGVRRQLVAQGARWDAAAPLARRPAVVADGRVLGWCRLYDDGELVEIDGVSVLPDERGRGIGRELMAGALASVPAGRLVFLRADPDDWPRLLYDKLGFDVIGERLSVTRAPQRRRA